MQHVSSIKKKMYWSLKSKAEGRDNAKAVCWDRTGCMCRTGGIPGVVGAEWWFKVRWGRVFHKVLGLYLLGSRNQHGFIYKWRGELIVFVLLED